MIDLTPERAMIFRITHRDNVRWIFGNGLHCASSGVRDPHFVSIGNPDLIQKRTVRMLPSPYSGKLSDYVPFYFTPHSPMLLNIKTGYGEITKRKNDEIAIIVSSLHRVQQQGGRFVFADRHAYMRSAQFSDNLDDLDRIDWDILRRRDFKRDPNDPEKFERYQAEALIAEALPVTSVLAVACCDDSMATDLQQVAARADVNVRVVARPAWYF